MLFLTLGAEMTRPSRTGGKTSEAKARSASLAKGRKTTKTKRPIAPTATRVKRRSVSGPSKELKEAREQQAATAEILKVIASSPSDVQPVFEAIVRSAAKLFEPCSATITTLKDDKLYWGATAASISGFDVERVRSVYPIPFDPDRAPSARAMLERRIVEIPDVAAPATPEFTRNAAAAGGFRSITFAPLVDREQGIGTIIFTHPQAGFRYSERQLALIQTFADQAVIAIQNARLFNEVQARTRDLMEALTYQTGSSNILSVIASSPTNVAPVLKAIADSACELCEAYDAVVLLKDGNDLRYSAHHGPIPIGLEKSPINRNWVTGRAVVDKVPMHVHDLLSAEGDQFPQSRETLAQQGHRTVLCVPLLREGQSIGAITLRRFEVNPFSDKQISMLQTFADQAVIAIGNVRLFDEVQAKTRDLGESLQQQTATADVLKVISRSAFDLQAVLDTLVESAGKLCNATMTNIWLRDGDVLRSQAQMGLSEAFSEFLRTHPTTRDRGKFVGRAFLTGELVHLPDVLADPEYTFVESPRIGQFRSALGVPMIRQGEVEGVFALAKPDPGGFTDREIELVRTFADQALIAIENVRLFEEVQARTRDLSESLEHQTAISDILRVISSSPGNVQPVLATVARHAAQICEAQIVDILIAEDDKLHYAAELGDFGRILYGETAPLNRETVMGRSVCDKQPVHVVDLQSMDHDFPLGREYALALGHRTTLAVPLIREDRALGTILVRRAEVRPFDDRHITLLKTFADQAAIAIENARLFNEVQDRTRELSQSLDELRTAQDRLIQTEKLASLGQLTAGIAHEIKNPLNFVNNFSALSAELTDELNDVLKPVAMDGKVREEVDELTSLLKDNLEKVVQHGKRADSIVQNMLLHSREGSREHRPADINSLLDESLNLSYHGARAEKGEFNITLERDFDADAGTIELFPQEITRAFLNLIANGVYAATRRKNEDKEPGFEPTLRATTKNLGNAVEIRIRDNGTGIPAEVQQKMFNPFFTTKPAGEGTGLGLSMTHDIIVKQHGGRIDVTTEPGQFTEFTIVLPRKSNLSGGDRGKA
jgi:GAF domain-containing protein